MKEIINILNYKLLGLNAFLLILFTAFSFSLSYAVPVLYLLWVNLFDILGYHFVLYRKSSQKPDKETIKSYRILQVMFDTALVPLLGLTFGWMPALCGLLLKMFGLQDILYYLFLKKKLPGRWHWLGFTPFGFIKKILSDAEVLVQAAAGIIITIIIFWYY